MPLALALLLFAQYCDARAKVNPALATADSLAARVEALAGVGRPADPELIAAARRVFEIRTRELGPSDPATLRSQERLAAVHTGRVEFRAADSLLERVVAARVAARPPDLHATISSMLWLSESHRGLKKLKSAVTLADSALALLRGSAAPDTSVEIGLHTVVGNACSELGVLERAGTELERAVSLEETRAHPDSARLAYSLRSLGRLRSIAGDSQGALTAFQRAVAIQERVFGPSSPEVATTLVQATFTLSEIGDYVEQRRYAERAMAIRERVFGPKHPNLAPVLWALGHAEANLGDPQAAQVHYERAVRILREGANVSAPDLATSLSNLGSNYMRLGDGAHALEYLLAARDLRVKLFGPGSGGGFWSNTRLAQARLMSGDASGARAALDSMIAGPGRPAPDELADALNVRASAQRVLGDRAAAEAGFSRAYVLEDSLLGATSLQTLGSLALRASLRYQLSRRSEALADAHVTEAASRSALRDIVRGLSEHEALGFERLRASGLDVMMALATDSLGVTPQERARVFDAIVRSRLVVLDELADELRAPQPANGQADTLHRQLETARDAYAAEMVTALRQGRAPDSIAADARERREHAERALAERSGPFRDVLRRSNADLAAVAAALPAGSALVSYVRYGSPTDVQDDASSEYESAPHAMRYAAFVLRAGSRAPALVRLGAAADLDQRIERWVTACATPPPRAHASALAALRRCDALGRSVRAGVWTPLERAIAGATSVFVVPDGALHAIDLLALPAAQGGYLAERGTLVHRLTAERDLLPWDAAQAAPRGLLAFGGVDFEHADDAPPALVAAALARGEQRSSTADTLRVKFAPLPATAVEVAEVAQLWRATSGSAVRGPAVELTGAAASEAAFKRLASGNRVLHLATHGFALGAADPHAAPSGTRGVGAVFEGEQQSRSHRVAALLPGLALAGANREPDPSREDGFLTAEEITSLDLSGVEWAVLSACESGLSDPDAVEAVQGLHRAFRRAGVRTVIMSLWQVDDAATRSWMDKLYEARLGGRMSTAAAVQAACRGLIRERRALGLDTHPFYWAAFVASGDWR